MFRHGTSSMRRGRIALLALVFSSASGLAAAATICKWTDDKGRVHYSNIAPPGVSCSTTIEVLSADPIEQQRAEERLKRMIEEERLLQERQRRHATESEVEELKKAQKAQRERSCADAKAQLKFLEEAYGMRLIRPAREGEDEMVFLDDDERQKVTESLRKQVEESCNESDTSPSDSGPDQVYGAPPPPRHPFFKPNPPQPPLKPDTAQPPKGKK